MSIISWPAGVPEPLPVRGILFDLDGTLIDTAPDLCAALNRLRGDFGQEPVALADVRPYVSYGARGMLRAGMRVMESDPRYAELRERFLQHYEQDLCRYSVPFAGIVDVLAEIGRRRLPWGVVTNKAKRFTIPLLRALNLSPPADCIVSGDSTEQTKPHPGPLLLAAKELGVSPSECVYVGDAARDVQAACAAGMYSLVALYGYIPADESPESWAATGWIKAPLDSLDWLPGSS